MVNPFLLTDGRTGQLVGLAMLVLLLMPGHARAQPTILILGDSLSAGYGIGLEQAWPSLLQRRVPDMRVVNASVSGETTAAGRARLPALLDRYEPAVVILELGANDGLRGLSVDHLYDNLAAMIVLSRRQGAEVLMLGMKIPPNYGRRYSEAFSDCFRRLAQAYPVAFVPFFLAGVAIDPEQMQSDGLHPRASAQPRLLENIWPALSPLLERLAGGH